MSQLFPPTALVVPFEKLRMADVESVGGKNASLGEMISQLPQGVRARVRFYEVAETAREVVLAMPRHLNSVRPFHDFAAELTGRVREAYVEDRLDLRPLPLAAPIATPGAA